MSVSVREGDHHFKVFLNGEPLKYCIWADEEAGEAEIYRLDLYKKGMKKIPRQKLKGKIEIRRLAQ